MKPERFEVYRIGGRYVCVTQSRLADDQPEIRYTEAMVGVVEVDGKYAGSKFGIPESAFKPNRRVTKLLRSESGREDLTEEEIVKRRMESGRAR
jgi:hypothetical protein